MSKRSEPSRRRDASANANRPLLMMRTTMTSMMFPTRKKVREEMFSRSVDGGIC